jgi:hypothetical protein
MDAKEKALDLARLDQMYADLRQYKEDIETIAVFGLPEPDDAGAAERQGLLVKMMACILLAELGAKAE